MQGDVIWVDNDDRELGVIPRTNAHREGLLHRIAIVYCTRPDGKILVQERMSGRFDHSSAGHVDPGEDYLTAAKRELKEELGIDAHLTPLGKITSDEVEPEGDHYRIRHIAMVYVTDAEPVALAQGEVKGVFWEDPKKILLAMERDSENKTYCGGFKTSLSFVTSLGVF